MRRQKVSIKKQIEKKIEFRNKSVRFLDTKGHKKMDELDELRNRKRINVELRTRAEIHMERMTGQEVSNDVQPILINKLPISIIITAYQTQDFIEKCLDSIENQTYFINNDKYEVLVGIDGCKETLYKVLKISHKYKNLRIFMMDSNMGTYVTSNTLLESVKYDNILRFDSDDVMRPEMINEIMYFIDDYDVVQFLFSDFTTDINQHTNNFKFVAPGAHFYKKSVIEIAGGYRAWKCAADSEFIKRISNTVKIKKINKRLFYRRFHSGSITNMVETNANSIIRKNYMKKIRIYGAHENINIKRKVNTFTEILV